MCIYLKHTHHKYALAYAQDTSACISHVYNVYLICTYLTSILFYSKIYTYKTQKPKPKKPLETFPKPYTLNPKPEILF